MPKVLPNYLTAGLKPTNSPLLTVRKTSDFCPNFPPDETNFKIGQFWTKRLKLEPTRTTGNSNDDDDDNDDNDDDDYNDNYSYNDNYHDNFCDNDDVT